MDRDGWDKRYAAEERVFSEEPNPLVEESLGDLPPGRGLDVAAGEGRHALWLAARGWRMTAVDFSSVGLDKGRAVAAERGLAVEWVLADVYEYPFPVAALDLVLIAHFHPEPADRERVFRDAARALVPGGHLLVVGRHVDDIGRDGGRGPRDPAFRYRPEELAAALPAEVRLLRCESVRRTVADRARGSVDLNDVIALGVRSGGTSGTLKVASGSADSA
jgi:SAM-dependent methyltransferase